MKDTRGAKDDFEFQPILLKATEERALEISVSLEVWFCKY